MHLMGFDPTEMKVLTEVQNQGLGEINLDKINIFGDIKTPKRMVISAFSKLVLKSV